MKEYYPFRGQSRPFSEAFPTVKQLRIDVEEWSIGSGKPLKTWMLTAETVSEDVKCHDPACNKKGGFDLMGVVREMIHERQPFREKNFIKCSGRDSGQMLIAF